MKKRRPVREIDTVVLEPHKSTHGWLQLSAALCGLGALFFFRSAFEPPYFDLIDVICGSTCALMVGVCIYCLFFLPSYKFTRAAILRNSGFKTKTFRREEVAGYGTRAYEKKYGSGEYLMVKFRDGRDIQLDSDSYFQFETLKSFVEQHYTNLGEEAFRRADFVSLLWWRLFCLGMASLFVWIYYQNETSDVDRFRQEVSRFEITLAETPREKKATKSSSRRYVLQAAEYPDFEFRIVGDAYQAFTWAGGYTLQPRQKINIAVDSEVYRTKLLRTKKPDFRTRHLWWDRIDILEVKSADHTYVTLDDSLADQRQQWNWGWLVFAGLAFAGLLASYWKT